MVNDTINRIEKEIAINKALSEEQKRELVDLVNQLKSEIGLLEEKYSEDARSIAKHAEISVQEATRENPNPALLQKTLDVMSFSARGFEVSHPKLVGTINSIGRTLVNIGV